MENAYKKRGLGVLETVLLCAFTGMLIAVSFYYVQRVVSEARGVAMKAELQNIRTAVNAYRARHGNQRPDSLRTLTAEKYIVQKNENNPQPRPFERHYLEVYALDQEGYPVDSFGNRYRYDPKSGDVVSGTPGYESW